MKETPPPSRKPDSTAGKLLAEIFKGQDLLK
jgi:hypothetical protein